MRRVVLDTETTGGSAKNGDRVVELGMVETMDHVPTGRALHFYFRAPRPIQLGASRVHGLTAEMLRDCPAFTTHAAEIRAFLGEDPILAHGAKFDRNFMNKEFVAARIAPPRKDNWEDTVALVRANLTGPAGLSTIVQKLGLKVPDRNIHGALLDAAVLAGVVAHLYGRPAVDIAGLASSGLPRPKKPPAPHNQVETTVYIIRAVAETHGEVDTMPEFIDGLFQRGVVAEPRIWPQKPTEMRGIRLHRDGIYLTASQVGLGKHHWAAGTLAATQDNFGEIAKAAQTACHSVGWKPKRVTVPVEMTARPLPVVPARRLAPGPAAKGKQREPERAPRTSGPRTAPQS